MCKDNSTRVCRIAPSHLPDQRCDCQSTNERCAKQSRLLEPNSCITSGKHKHKQSFRAQHKWHRETKQKTRSPAQAIYLSQGAANLPPSSLTIRRPRPMLSSSLLHRGGTTNADRQRLHACTRTARATDQSYGERSNAPRKSWAVKSRRTFKQRVCTEEKLIDVHSPSIREWVACQGG